MRERDLPSAAKHMLHKWKMSRTREKDNIRDAIAGSSNDKNVGKGRGIRLLDNRKETLEELSKEFQIDGAVEVICNTQKLQQL